MLTMALAPNEAMNWPLMAPPPSYVISPNRFTIPIVNRKVKAGEDPVARRVADMVACSFEKSRAVRAAMADCRRGDFRVFSQTAGAVIRSWHEMRAR
ncbi:hypothetical protein [Bradyrhizobium sp. BWA-3-5]|uniref:hypothetical protein n=1 Tax=Bradyrhizobium sp. BWA-3-5 TaxID=3080013 RepID=UPI00293E5D4A|nr:hypothetical protein [Bradyrhizobium sp. BWA-3-5]WOH65091.1 hypothetical protein RX331_31790 [Bradyrhizobium sp. BWA-3-5]